ncbi:Predicted small secreted protein [Pelagirhabdus alkalitolerans]|uniref:Predicted small secreted protein n=1 Tax=Pelagirhabdus alkalitolerans TaxID=1612202 RepID=A0A1G6HKF4_9BACI|nr:PepSY domain-containing protein [Pelagirhabdus alkalitolerans]SDB93906.1 Predicted small secreted protein [Pelagirhabdus alkalitolerans]
MNWKKTLSTIGVGIAIGYLLNDQLQKMPIRPEDALKMAKEKFRVYGSVSGSWIYMKTEPLTIHGLDYIVYRGGITRTINEESIQYEFFIDAHTGTIIHAEESNHSI